MLDGVVGCCRCTQGLPIPPYDAAWKRVFSWTHTRWRRPELIQLLVIRRRPKLNQLEHINLADDEDQLQALKSKVNQLSPFKKKKKKKKKHRWSWNEEVQQEATVEDSADEKRKRRRIENQQKNRENQQVACIPDARGSDVVKEIQSQATVQSADAIWRLAIAKRCRLHKLIRQRFALAIKIQQEDFALLFQQTKLQCPVATQRYPVASLASSRDEFQTQATAASSRRAYLYQLLLRFQSL
ncbi:putative dimethyladenosine transferase [Dorcoceras hygrometricum]|uniref:Putative dimethyladenosine transferase n=1 Tax=Dorcoceras hygrometricum TaxID=472368 RepID=A0A2Z7AKV0_9LAMI|nr:putative dimethyladenosine transferase [Dorcoceras hygrometricum]